MNALRSWWEALAPREQRVLRLGAVALLLIGGWLLVWEPLAKARDTWHRRVQAGENDLAWMRAHAPQLRALAGGSAGTTPVRDGRSLLALVDATARASGVGDALLRVEPVAANQVRVYFEGAEFDALVQWLQELGTRQGVVLGDFNANRAAGVGRVDARLALERSGD